MENKVKKLEFERKITKIESKVIEKEKKVYKA